jgi:hypothetical protein
MIANQLVANAVISRIFFPHLSGPSAKRNWRHSTPKKWLLSTRRPPRAIDVESPGLAMPHCVSY